jgi:hypothetical protein
MRTTIFPLVAALVFCAGIVRAAQAPLSPEELEKAATHIIAGVAEKVTSKVVPNATGSGNTDRVYEISLRIEEVKKGTGVAKDDVIVVVAWRPESRKKPFPGPQGHSNIPKKSGAVRVYLKKSDDGYKVIHPNGFHALETTSEK